ncbi:hypothetical protein [Streptosporangium sp. V21-05]|uniref:hypothetical protein n=1 Tax=Streptosporangium sp. V21-05 TaxID=3446115 RepID=UPI003F53BD90
MKFEEAKEDRRRLLRELIELRRPVSDLVDKLRKYSWDIDAPLESVEAEDVARILDSYLSGQIPAATLTEWADALEMRDDVQIDEHLFEFFSEASSPEINESISTEFARRWMSRLI